MNGDEEDRCQNAQTEEFEVIKSMYGDDVTDLRYKKKTWNIWKPLELLIHLYPSQGVSGNLEIHSSLDLYVSCPAKYPIEPPKIKLSNVQNVAQRDLNGLHRDLRAIIDENLPSAEVVLMELCQCVRDFLHERNQPPPSANIGSLLDSMVKAEELKNNIQINKKQELEALKIAEIEEELKRRQELKEYKDGNLLSPDPMIGKEEVEKLKHVRIDPRPPPPPSPSESSIANNNNNNEGKDYERGDLKELKALVGTTTNTRLDNEFIITKWLGRGGFGDVLQVKNKLDGNFYAIKRIRLDPRSRNLNRKIVREVKLLSRLNHENVVRYYNSWIEAIPNAIYGDQSPSIEDNISSQSNASNKDQNVSPSPATVENEGDSLEELVAAAAGNNFDVFDDAEAENVHAAASSINWGCSYSNWGPSGSNGLAVGGALWVGDSSSSSSSSDEEDVDEDESLDESSSGMMPKVVKTGVVAAGAAARTKAKTTNEDCSIVFQRDGNEKYSMSQPSTSAIQTPPTKHHLSSSASSSESIIQQTMFIQMEFCENHTLREWIDQGKLFGQTKSIWRLFREILEGLYYIHYQVLMIHRDIKPVNIFLDRDLHAKIGDFGLACKGRLNDGGRNEDTASASTAAAASAAAMNESSLDDGGSTTAIGTALYVAPELLNPALVSPKKTDGVQGNGETKGEGPGYSQKVDIFSAGIVLFEMFHRPWDSQMERVETLRALRSVDIKIPDDFADDLSMKQRKNLMKLLRWVLEHDVDARASSEELVKSELLPPLEMQETEFQSTFLKALSNAQTRNHKWIIGQMFAQLPNSAIDYCYDKDLDLYKREADTVRYWLHEEVEQRIAALLQNHALIRLLYSSLATKCVVACPNPMLQRRERVRNHSSGWTKVFHLGAGAGKATARVSDVERIKAPHFLPKNSELPGVSFMDNAGVLITIPLDLRFGFARYLVRHQISQIRRYDFGTVFRGPVVPGSHPRETDECAVDIVTEGIQSGGVAGGQILVILQTICHEFVAMDVLDGQRIQIALEDSKCVAKIQESNLKLIQDLDDKLRATILSLVSVVKSDKDIFCLIRNNLLQNSRRAETPLSRAIKEARNEIERVLKSARNMGLTLTANMCLGLVVRDGEYDSGFVFQLTYQQQAADNNKKTASARRSAAAALTAVTNGGGGGGGGGETDSSSSSHKKFGLFTTAARFVVNNKKDDHHDRQPSATIINFHKQRKQSFQGVLAAGGRYDNLLEMFRKRMLGPTPANPIVSTGCSISMSAFVTLLQQHRQRETGLTVRNGRWIGVEALICSSEAGFTNGGSSGAPPAAHQASSNSFAGNISSMAAPSLLPDKLNLARTLWSHSIRAAYVVEPIYGSLEGLEGAAAECGVQFILLIKAEPSSHQQHHPPHQNQHYQHEPNRLVLYKSWSSGQKRYMEKKVAMKEVVDYVSSNSPFDIESVPNCAVEQNRNILGQKADCRERSNSNNRTIGMSGGTAGGAAWHHYHSDSFDAGAGGGGGGGGQSSSSGSNNNNNASGGGSSTLNTMNYDQRGGGVIMSESMATANTGNLNVTFLVSSESSKLSGYNRKNYEKSIAAVLSAFVSKLSQKVIVEVLATDMRKDVLNAFYSGLAWKSSNPAAFRESFKAVCDQLPNQHKEALSKLYNNVQDLLFLSSSTSSSSSYSYSSTSPNQDSIIVLYSYPDDFYRIVA